MLLETVPIFVQCQLLCLEKFEVQPKTQGLAQSKAHYNLLAVVLGGSYGIPVWLSITSHNWGFLITLNWNIMKAATSSKQMKQHILQEESKKNHMKIPWNAILVC